VAEKLPDNPELEPLTRSQVLIAMGVTAVVLLLVSKLWLHFGNVALLSLRWNRFDCLLGLGGGLLITILSSIIYRFWAAYRQSADFYLDIVLKPLVLPDLVWLGLLPGLSEELLFRGVMLPALGLDWNGLTISSLCFGILHFSSPKQWAYVIWATIVGFMLGYVTIETRNLLVPVLAHILTNLVSSYIWKLKHQSQTI
jgi:membrane protease YdiL (CAAX protease family)